jgi:hypothetical protein
MIRAILSCLLVVPLAGCSTGACGVACNPEAPVPGEPLVLEELWRLGHEGHGVFEGIAAEPVTGDIHIVCGRSRDSMTLLHLDRHGQTREAVQARPCGTGGDMLRLADLTGDGAPELIVSGGWSDAVTA